MRVHDTRLAGVLVIEPDVYRDARGWFLETWHAARYAGAGMPPAFVQDNQSRSVRGTLRGLHWQEGRPQGKLVRVVEGTAWDVAVDLRPDSPTFGDWFAVELSADNFLQCYLPPGTAHGFCVLTDVGQLEYKCTDYYDPAAERGLIWNDPDLAIPWPVTDPLLSPRDRMLPSLREVFPQGPSRPRTSRT